MRSLLFFTNVFLAVIWAFASGWCFCVHWLVVYFEQLIIWCFPSPASIFLKLYSKFQIVCWIAQDDYFYSKTPMHPSRCYFATWSWQQDRSCSVSRLNKRSTQQYLLLFNLNMPKDYLCLFHLNAMVELSFVAHFHNGMRHAYGGLFFILIL